MSPALSRWKTIATFVFAWVASGYVAGRRFAVNRWTEDAIDRILSGFPAFGNDLHHIWRAFSLLGGRTWFVGLWFGTIAWTLGALVRMVARARVRSGQADFLDPVREWTDLHPQETRLLAAIPGALWALALFLSVHSYRWNIPNALVFLALLNGAAMAWWAHRSARALLAPTITGSTSTRFAITPDEIVFDAVAVTTETKGAVAALLALTVATVAFLGSRSMNTLYHSRALFEVMLGYVTIASTSAVVFRLASRVAVGVDGVHVRGTSRAKFFAYRELDDARSNGSDLELVRRGRVILRLQLHGEDAARRDAVLARIREHVARVKEGKGATAAQLVASASKETLARVAHGGADYRMAALTREQLWALVEGPEIEASARKAAAVALVGASGVEEKARLRVAAEHCAEPSVRVALEEIAQGEPEGRQGMRRAAM